MSSTLLAVTLIVSVICGWLGGNFLSNGKVFDFSFHSSGNWTDGIGDGFQFLIRLVLIGIIYVVTTLVVAFTNSILGLF